MIHVAVDDLLECTDGVFELHILTGHVGELLGHVEWLTQKFLNLTSSLNDLPLLFREFVHTQNGNDVLKVTIPL